MVAQVPELFETLTGQKVSDLMQRLRALGRADDAVTVPPRDTHKTSTSTDGKD